MMLFLPELLLLCAGLVLFFTSLAIPDSKRLNTIALCCSAIIVLATASAITQQGTLFFQAYRIDLFSQTFKLLIAISFFIVVSFSSRLPGIHKSIRSEYYLFLFMSVLGLMMLVSSVELLAIFVSLELSSFTVYLLVPMRDETGRFRFQMEAGAKYLLFGVMATGFMLFGMSYLFGLTGTTHMSALMQHLPAMYSEPAAVVAIVLVLTGFFYKLAIFPFHFWVPDVYQGAANETTAFIATIPKLAAVALLIRFTVLAQEGSVIFVNLLMVCAICSMFYGNLSALVQKDLKRMLGFSGIAHAGFVLLGLLVFNITGYVHAIYYIVGYVIMNLACFLVICTVSSNGENLAISQLKGLYKRAPLLAITLLIGLFALAGIPPFVGFIGKFFLLVDALQKDYLLLVVLAAINTAIAIFYYLSVVRIAFCSDDETYDPITLTPQTKLLCSLLIFGIIVMGVFPGTFIEHIKTILGTVI